MEGHPHPAEASLVVGFYFMYWIFSVEYVYFIYMKYEMILTYVFFGIFLIFATMFILCDGEAAFYDR